MTNKTNTTNATATATAKKESKPARNFNAELDKMQGVISKYGTFEYHKDLKKKKLMVRYSGKKMLFKCFLQKGDTVKVHLKNKEDWPAEYQKDAFFQNGFNLAWAVKMPLADFETKFLPWVTSEYLTKKSAPKAKPEKAPAPEKKPAPAKKSAPKAKKQPATK